jgi:hypothetical protein
VDTDGHLRDSLDALHLNASRGVEWGPVSRLKLGARVTDREKDYRQTTWNMQPVSAIADSEYESVKVDGLSAPYLALKDFMGSTLKAFGAKAYDPSGRTQTRTICCLAGR